MKRLGSEWMRLLTTVLLVCSLLGLTAATGCTSKEERHQEALDTGADSFAEGDFDSAVTELEAAEEIDPEDAGTLFLLGQAYEAQGDLVAAEEAYLRSLDADAAQPAVLYNLAIIQKADGRLEEASGSLTEAVELDSEFVGARLALGDVYAQLGKRGEAAAQYEAMLEMEPIGVDLDVVRDKLDEL